MDFSLTTLYSLWLEYREYTDHIRKAIVPLVSAQAALRAAPEQHMTARRKSPPGVKTARFLLLWQPGA